MAELKQKQATPAQSALNLKSAGPKHLGAGLGQALKSVASGVVGGAAALVAAPAMGAKEGGAAGFAKGLGIGVMGAVALPIVGVVSGVGSIARGALNTPEAVKASAEGKEWDPVSQTWILYTLENDKKRLLSEEAETELKEYLRQRDDSDKQEAGETDDEQAAEITKTVKETALYDELGVEPSASEAQIKKAYYKQALKYHPDKNPGDAAAQAKFQALSRAYEVLSNPDARERYDETGNVDEDAESLVDPKTFFEIIFGSEQFERLVGELQLASLMKEDDHDVDAVESDFRQRQRRVRLASTLVDDVLAPFVTGVLDEAAFASKVRTEIAEELVSTPFGATLVRVIAYVYRTTALRYLGGVRGAALSVSDTAHKAGKRLEVAHGAARIFARAKSAQRAASKSEEASKHASAIENDSDARTVDGKPIEEAAFLIVSDKHGEWSVAYYANSVAASAAYKKLSYSFASVLFAREDRSWKPTKTYGTTAASNRIIAAIAGHDENAALTNVTVAESAVRNREKEMVSSVLEAAWRVSVIDIETTLRDATSKLFRDKGVDETTRKKRAKALKIVAEALQAAADQSGHSKVFSELLLKQMEQGTPFTPPPASPEDGSQPPEA